MRERAALEAEIEFGRWQREAVRASQARMAAGQLGEAFRDDGASPVSGRVVGRDGVTGSPQ